MVGTDSDISRTDVAKSVSASHQYRPGNGHRERRRFPQQWITCGGSQVCQERAEPVLSADQKCRSTRNTGTF